MELGCSSLGELDGLKSCSRGASKRGGMMQPVPGFRKNLHRGTSRPPAGTHRPVARNEVQVKLMFEGNKWYIHYSNLFLAKYF